MAAPFVEPVTKKRKANDARINEPAKEEVSLRDQVLSLKVTVTDLTKSKPQTIIPFFLGRFLPVIKLTNMGWAVPPPNSGITLGKDSKSHFYTYQGKSTRDEAGDLRIHFYAASHGSNHVLRHGDSMLIIPWNNQLPGILAYGNTSVKYDPDLLDPLLQAFLQFGVPKCTIATVQQLGESMGLYINLNEEVRAKILSEIKLWTTDESVEFARIKEATTSPRRPLKQIATTFLSHHLSGLSLGEFLEKEFDSLSLEASVSLLSTLNLGYPLKKLGGNMVDAEGVKLTSIKLGEAESDDNVITSTSTLTLQSIRQLSPTTSVFVLPPKGLFRKVQQAGKGKSAKLIPLELMTTKASHLKQVLEKVEKEKPQVVAKSSSSDAEDKDGSNFVSIKF